MPVPHNFNNFVLRLENMNFKGFNFFRLKKKKLISKAELVRKRDRGRALTPAGSMPKQL